MKKSELIKIIKEEVNAVLREKEEDKDPACTTSPDHQRGLARQIGSKTALYTQDQLEEIYNVLGCEKFMKKVYNPLNRMKDSLDRSEALEKYLKTPEYQTALKASKNQKIVKAKKIKR